MLNKLNDLSFVIGAFFTIVSVILFVNIFASGSMDKVGLMSASAYLIFGQVMMFSGKKK